MKNTRWQNHLSKGDACILNKAGFLTNEDFNNVPVMSLFLLKQTDGMDANDLLKALFFEENRWRIGDKPIFKNASEKQGRSYLHSIFETYGFYDHPEWFYRMTIRELLDLEFIEEKFIPFVTSLMKVFLKDHEVLPCFINKQDIEERFEEEIGDPADPIFKRYEFDSYGTDYDDYKDWDENYEESDHWEQFDDYPM